MSNSTSGNPLSLDSSVANFAALNLPNKLPILVSRIIWVNPQNNGDTFFLKNKDGLILLNGVAQAGISQSWQFDPKRLYLTYPQGWYLQQISSGTLEIFF
jgi:hypothetical protein